MKIKAQVYEQGIIESQIRFSALDEAESPERKQIFLSLIMIILLCSLAFLYSLVNNNFSFIFLSSSLSSLLVRCDDKTDENLFLFLSLTLSLSLMRR